MDTAGGKDEEGGEDWRALYEAVQRGLANEPKREPNGFDLSHSRDKAEELWDAILDLLRPSA